MFPVVEKAVFVVANKAPKPVFSGDTNSAVAIRAAVDQVAQKEHAVMVPGRKLFEEILEFVRAAVHIADGYEFPGHWRFFEGSAVEGHP